MSERWSLSNLFRPVSFGQFRELGQEFQAAFEQAFNGKSNLTIRFMSEPKVFSSFALDDESRRQLDAYNQGNTFAELNNLEDATEVLWNAAQYVEIIMKPANEETAPAYAFSHMDFKGRLPKTATYYIQGPEEKIGPSIMRNHRSMTEGDGFAHHGYQSINAYMAVSRQLGMPGLGAAVLAHSNDFKPGI